MYKWNFYKLLLLCFVLSGFCSATVFAQPTTQTSPFMPVKWNKSVDLIESKLTSTDWTTEKINNTQAVLTDLQKNAKECINYTQAELEKINLAVAQSAVTNPNQTQQLAAVSLNGKEVELNDLRAECRLFMLHSQDIRAEVDKLEEHIIAVQVFSKGPSIIENIQKSPSLKALINQVDTSLLRQKLGLPYFTKLSFLIMGLLVLVSTAFGWGFSKFSSRKLVKVKKASLFYTVLAVFSQYTYLLSFSFIFSIFFILFSWPNFFILPGQVSSYIFIYLVLLAIIRVIFYPPSAAKPLVSLPGSIPSELNLRLFYLLTLVLAFYICTAIVEGQNFPVTVFELGMTLYISLLSLSVIGIVWLVMSFPKFLALNKYLRAGLNIFFTTLLITVLISEWLGFHYFSILLIKDIVVTFILACLALSLHIITGEQIRRLKSNQYIRHHLGIRFNRSIPELDILQAVLLVVIWGGLVAILLNSWALSESYYGELVSAFSDGFTIIGITLVPSRILMAMVIFVFLALGNRLMQVYITRRSPYYIEEGTQVATASIIGYAGFTVSIIFALVIAGVNFTGLAIIAGALSVGIGFGLQNIANNFISGLILLLDNPIRPGDRIQVGDIEGIVKRIRLRATHIYTLRHADVFIPNSELISKSVTNFVFHDKTWSIVCPVGVEYGCDIDQVKSILIKVAEAHPEVIQEEGKKPKVYFKKFSDSSLSFELWCLIHDVSKKSGIESDLNSAIYTAFREGHINIPYPQQDIHIKDWPEHPAPAAE